MTDAIILQGVKTHNLKNLDLIFPHRKLYVISGVSGSGKSSLAFDTLYAEGQRRYVESLSAYARQFLERMERPDVDSVSGMPPAIAIAAKNVINNARSTVGTQTEINDYLRVFFSRIGKMICPDCHEEITEHEPATIADYLLERHGHAKVLILFEVPFGAGGLKNLDLALAELKRQGFVEFYSGGRVVTEADLLKNKKKWTGAPVYVALDRLTVETGQRKRLLDSLDSAFRFGRGRVTVVFETPLSRESTSSMHFSQQLQCPKCTKTFRKPLPNSFSFNSPLGACQECQGFGRVITLDWDLVVPDVQKSIAAGAIEPWTKPSAAWERRQLLKFCQKKKIPLNKPWKDLPLSQREVLLIGKGVADPKEYVCVRDYFEYLETKKYKMHIRIFLAKYRKFVPCGACHETRLKPEALCVWVAGKNIHDVQTVSLESALRYFELLEFNAYETEKVEPVYLEILRRLRFLRDVGLGYLSLARLSRTLSGGEVQRIHLASSLGSALVDTLYVLDEPSIGLHERDNQLLIHLLKQLRDLGNTVVVVEHDRTMIESADEIIDMGPLGGEKGGHVLYQGNVAGCKTSPESLTGQYLSGKRVLDRRYRRKPEDAKNLWVRGAAEHNLKNIDVCIPLRQFVVLSGVSGSGKSTLLYDVLYSNYLRCRGSPVQNVGRVKKIEGWEDVEDMVLIDQSPIGRTPRSNPATYLKIFDDIRKIFSRTAEARRQNLTPGHFSFNVDGGRCPACQGDGRIKVEMHFLADVFITCEACRGKRFQESVLDIRYREKNIDEVLSMTVDDAVSFFAQDTGLTGKMEVLQKVGLGYLKLGQPATTLSGGEAQRLKIAYEMSHKDARHLLYLFDEPTTGLHYHDIQYLLHAVEELLERGHSVLMIEHNLEMIQAADFIVDLGPEGGEQGGKVLYQGPVDGILGVSNSFTGKYLKALRTAPGLETFKKG